MQMIRLANLALLVLFPLSWFAPLMRAGMLPLFGLSEITLLTGLQSLWSVDIPLALLVTFLALVAPMVKTLGLVLIHWRMASPRLLTPLKFIGRLAMADVFLVAIYVVLAKGIGFGRVETAWGLYLFTGCILASLGLSFATERARKNRRNATQAD
jgi:paraquat-inducible protein A